MTHISREEVEFLNMFDHQIGIQTTPPTIHPQITEHKEKQ